MPAVALAGPHDTAPGTPGAANCHGQTAAFLAQASKTQLGAPGLGNLAAAVNVSVSDVQTVIDTFCNP